MAINAQKLNISCETKILELFCSKKGGLWELLMIVGVVLSKHVGPGQTVRFGRYGQCKKSQIILMITSDWEASGYFARPSFAVYE